MDKVLASGSALMAFVIIAGLMVRFILLIFLLRTRPI